MSFHFHFKGLEDKTELNNLIDFLILQDLGYPNYDQWVGRTEHELDTGYKEVVLAFSGRQLVGDLIYQPHKEISCFLELKNLRINPKLRTRKFAEFMLRQVEAENKNKYDAIICDAPYNHPAINFMKLQGYSIFDTIPLYDKNNPDVVMLRFLNKDNENLMKIAEEITFKKAI